MAIAEQFLHLLRFSRVCGPETVAGTPVADNQFLGQTCWIEQSFSFSLRDVCSFSQQSLDPDTEFADFNLARNTQAIFVLHWFLQSARWLEAKISLGSTHVVSARQFELLPGRSAGKITNFFDHAKRDAQIVDVGFQPSTDQSPLGGEGQRQQRGHGERSLFCVAGRTVPSNFRMGSLPMLLFGACDFSEVGKVLRRSQSKVFLEERHQAVANPIAEKGQIAVGRVLAPFLVSIPKKSLQFGTAKAQERTNNLAEGV